jgi:hypothetical protein
MTGEFTDQTLTCIDCRAKFVWASGEQSFFADKGFTEPKRCKPCRDRKKAARLQNAGAAIEPAPLYDKDQQEMDNAKENRRRRFRGR